jgi:hypothetical protein
MSETGLTVPDMNEPLSQYNVTVTAGCEGGSLPDPAAFAAAADQAAWRRSASIISAHLADKIISVVTVTAPDRYAGWHLHGQTAQEVVALKIRSAIAPSRVLVGALSIDDLVVIADSHIEMIYNNATGRSA